MIPPIAYKAAIIAGSMLAAYLVGYASSSASAAREQAAAAEKRGAAIASQINSRQDKVRTAEASAASAQADFVADYNRKIQNDLREKDRIIADLRAGNVRLRDAIAARSADSVPQASGAASGSHGKEAGGLHPETSAALFEIGRDADEVAEKLALCQKVVIQQQKLCNGE